MRRFTDREAAGRELADVLARDGSRSFELVLGLPRGGVPVAAPVAHRLEVPLDVFVVRKLGVPGHEELAMGAIASGGVRVMNDDIVRACRVSDQTIEDIARREADELRRREELYRGSRPPLDVSDRAIVVVDDGVATGASVAVAVRALRRLDASHVTVAVPVAPPDTVRSLGDLADEVVAVATPEPFHAVGFWYGDFTQTTDDEVVALLAEN